MDALGGTQQGRGRALAAEERLRGDLGDLSRRGVRDTQRFGMDLARARGVGLSEAQRLRSGLAESKDLLRGTTGELDIAAETAKYQDPYEDQVVQQMIQDATEGLAKQDMAQYARDISSGGESAFGSRARLSAAERAEALGRGLAKSVGGLRSQGFQRAQQTAIGEDERRRQAARTASAGLAGLRGQDYSAGTGYGNLLQQTAQQQLGAQQRLGGQLGQAAQQRFAAGTGLGQALSGYGAQDAAARMASGS
jgi:Sec-independent protein translocase protein TatA